MGHLLLLTPIGDKQAALSVNAVLGVRDLDTIMTIGELPTLLQRASKDVVEMIGMLDQQVLMVLRAGWELPDEVWRCYRSFASRSRAHRIAE